MVVIAVSAVLLSIVSSALASLYAIERRQEIIARSSWDASRLPDRLRQDVWSAARLQWQEPQQRLVLTMLDETTVSYHFDSPRCRRIVAGDPLATEQVFRMPGAGSVAIEPQQAEAREVVRLDWTPVQSNQLGPRPLTLQLVVARDERLLIE